MATKKKTPQAFDYGGSNSSDYFADLVERDARAAGVFNKSYPQFETPAQAGQQAYHNVMQQAQQDEEPVSFLEALNPMSEKNYAGQAMKSVAEQFAGIGTSTLDLLSLVDPTKLADKEGKGLLARGADIGNDFIQKNLSSGKEWTMDERLSPIESGYLTDPRGLNRDLWGMFGSMAGLWLSGRALTWGAGKVLQGGNALLKAGGIDAAPMLKGSLQTALNVPTEALCKMTGKSRYQLAKQIHDLPQWARILIKGSDGLTKAEQKALPWFQRELVGELGAMSAAEVIAESGEVAGDKRREGAEYTDQLTSALKTGAVEWATLPLAKRVQIAATLKLFGAQNVATAIGAGAFNVGQQWYEEGIQRMSQDFGKAQGFDGVTDILNPFAWSEGAHQEAFAGGVGAILPGATHAIMGARSRRTSKADAAVQNAEDQNKAINEAVIRNAQNEANKANFGAEEARQYLEDYINNESAAGTLREEAIEALKSNDANTIIAKAQDIELTVREAEDTIPTQEQRPVEAPVEATEQPVVGDDISVPFATNDEVEAAMEAQQQAQQKTEAVAQPQVQEQPTQAEFVKHNWLQENQKLENSLSSSDKTAINNINATVNNTIRNDVLSGVYDVNGANALSEEVAQRVNRLLGNQAENKVMTVQEARDALGEIDELESRFGIKNAFPSSTRAFYLNQLKKGVSQENAKLLEAKSNEILDRFERGEIDYNTAQAGFKPFAEAAKKANVDEGFVDEADIAPLRQQHSARLNEIHQAKKAQRKIDDALVEFKKTDKLLNKRLSKLEKLPIYGAVSDFVGKVREDYKRHSSEISERPASVAVDILAQARADLANKLSEAPEAIKEFAKVVADEYASKYDALEEDARNKAVVEQETERLKAEAAAKEAEVKRQIEEASKQAKEEQQQTPVEAEADADKVKSVPQIIKGWIKIPQFESTNEFEIRKLSNGDYSVNLFTDDGAEHSILNAEYVEKMGGDPLKALVDSYTYDEAEPAQIMEEPQINTNGAEENKEVTPEQTTPDDDHSYNPFFDGQVFDFGTAEGETKTDSSETDTAIQGAKLEEKVEKIVEQREEAEDAIDSALAKFGDTKLKNGLKAIKSFDWRQVVNDAIGKKPVIVVKEHGKAKSEYNLTYEGHVGLIKINKSVADVIGLVDKDTYSTSMRDWLGQGTSIDRAISKIQNPKEMHGMYDFFLNNEEEKAIVNGILDLANKNKAKVRIVNDSGSYIVTVSKTDGQNSESYILGKESGTLLSQECGVVIESAKAEEIPDSAYSDYLADMGEDLDEESKEILEDTFVEINGEELSIEQACRTTVFDELKDGSKESEDYVRCWDSIENTLREIYLGDDGANDEDAQADYEYAYDTAENYCSWLKEKYQSVISARVEKQAKAYNPRERIVTLVRDRVDPKTKRKYKEGDQAVLEAKVDEILKWVEAEGKNSKWKTDLSELNNLLDFYNKTHQKENVKEYTPNEKEAAEELKNAVKLYNNNDGNPNAVAPIKYTMEIGKAFSKWCDANSVDSKSKAAKEYIRVLLVQRDLNCSIDEAEQAVSNFLENIESVANEAKGNAVKANKAVEQSKRNSQAYVEAKNKLEDKPTMPVEQTVKAGLNEMLKILDKREDASTYNAVVSTINLFGFASKAAAKSDDKNGFLLKVTKDLLDKATDAQLKNKLEELYDKSYAYVHWNELSKQYKDTISSFENSAEHKALVDEMNKANDKLSEAESALKNSKATDLKAIAETATDVVKYYKELRGNDNATKIESAPITAHQDGNDDMSYEDALNAFFGGDGQAQLVNEKSKAEKEAENKVTNAMFPAMAYFGNQVAQRLAKQKLSTEAKYQQWISALKGLVVNDRVAQIANATKETLEKAFNKFVRPAWEFLNALPKNAVVEVQKIKKTFSLVYQAKAHGASLEQAKRAASQIKNAETNAPYEDIGGFVEAAYKAHNYLTDQGGKNDVNDDSATKVSGRTDGNRNEDSLGVNLETTDTGASGRDVEATGDEQKLGDLRKGAETGQHNANGGTSTSGTRGNNGAVQTASTTESSTSRGQQRGRSDSSSTARVHGTESVGVRKIESGAKRQYNAQTPISIQSETAEARSQREIVASIGKDNQPQVKRNDFNNIKKTLPVLLDDQIGDILKMEKRFFESMKQAFLVGNGTGTGKTFVGLGAIVRHMLSSKEPVLVVVPSVAIKNEWVKDAYEHFGIDGFNDLGTTTEIDAKKINIITYAAMVSNPNLIKQNFGMVVFDEAHHLASGEKTFENYNTTAFVQVMRGLTGHDSEHGFTGWRRLKRSDIFDKLSAARKELEKVNRKIERLQRLGETDKANVEAKKASELLKRIESLTNALKSFDKADREEHARYKAKAKEGKVLFLSATPFEYSNDIYWAEGYLFNYDDFGGFDKLMKNQLGLELKQVSSEEPDLQRGIEQRPGQTGVYQKGKIADTITGKPIDKDLSLLERRFHYLLKSIGSFITRRLSTPMNYSRKFVIVSSDETKAVIDGLREVLDSEDYNDIGKIFQGRLQGAGMRRFFEIVKTKALLDEVEKCLANGEHVLFVHKFKKSEVDKKTKQVVEDEVVHPFKLTAQELKGLSKKQQRDYEDFCVSPLGKKLQSLPLDTSMSVPEILKQRFGDEALIVNGDISEEGRRAAIAKFNEDVAEGERGKLLAATGDSIGEGVSAHDKTGGQRRKLINVAIPEKPSDVAQIEARIFRCGQMSNAQMYYITTDTPDEQFAYIRRASAKATSQENLSVGDEARYFIDSFNLNYLRALTGAVKGESVKISEDEIDSGSKEEDAGVDAEGKPIDFGALIQEQRNILADITKKIASEKDVDGHLDRKMSDAVSRAQAQLVAIEKRAQRVAENGVVVNPETEARFVNTLSKLCFAKKVDHVGDGLYDFHLRNGLVMKLNMRYSSIELIGRMSEEQKVRLKAESNYKQDAEGLGGLTSGNFIFLTDLANGDSPSHELMHFVFNVLLTPSQQKILLGWAKYNLEHGIANPFTEGKAKDEYKVSFKGMTQKEIDARCKEYISDGLPNLIKHEESLKNAKGLTGAIRRIYFEIQKWFANLKAQFGKDTPLGIYIKTLQGQVYDNEQQRPYDYAGQAQIVDKQDNKPKDVNSQVVEAKQQAEANLNDIKSLDNKQNKKPLNVVGWFGDINVTKESVPKSKADTGKASSVKDDSKEVRAYRSESQNIQEIAKRFKKEMSESERASLEVVSQTIQSEDYAKGKKTYQDSVKQAQKEAKQEAKFKREQYIAGIRQGNEQKESVNRIEGKPLSFAEENQEKYNKGIPLSKIEEEQKRKENKEAHDETRKELEELLKETQDEHKKDPHSIWKSFLHEVLNLVKNVDIKEAEKAGVNGDETDGKSQLEKESIFNRIQNFLSPGWIAEVNPQVRAFVKMGVKASRVQEEYRAKWLGVYQNALSTLDGNKEILALNKLLFDGDAEGKEYSDADLKKKGLSQNVIKAYKEIRKLVDEIYDEIDKAHRHLAPKFTKMVKGDKLLKKLAELQTDKFNSEFAIKLNSDDEYISFDKFDVASIDANKNYDITYMRPTVIKEHRTVLRSELDHLKADPYTQVVSIKDNNLDSSDEDFVEVELNRTLPPIAKNKGYMPHIFEEWIIVVETKDKNGRPVKNTVGSAKTYSEAMKLAKEKSEKITKSDKYKNAEIKVRPKIYDANLAFGGTGVDEFLGYTGRIISTPQQANQFKQYLIKQKGLTAEEAEQAVKEHLKMSQAHRFLGALIERTGAIGYNSDMLEAFERYIKMTSRYIALEDFKSTAIPLYERTFGTSFDLDAPSQKYESSSYIKRYIMNINGTPNAAERWMNNVFKNIPWFKKHIIANYGDRAALGLGSRINQFWAVTKLSGISSAMVNMLQLANTLAFTHFEAMGKGIKGAYMVAHKAPKEGTADYDKYMLYKQVIKDSGLETMMNMSDVSGYSKNRATVEATKEGQLERARQYWRWLSDKGMYLFKKSDHTSRVITAIAAYEKFMEDEEAKQGKMTDKEREFIRKKEHKRAIEYTEDILRKAMFDYGVADTSLAMQSLTGTGFGEMLILFKKYPMKEMELMLNMTGMIGNKTSGKDRAYFWLTYALMCGISGFPLGDWIDLITEKLYGYKLTTLLKANVIKGLGNNALSKAICYGGFSLGGVDISRRAGMADLLPTTGLLELMGGVTYSSFNQLADGYRQDDYIKMLKAISPSVGNAAEAVRGVRYDSKGRVAYKYDGLERIPKGMGFRLASESVISDLQSYEWQDKNATSEKRKLTMYRIAKKEADGQKITASDKEELKKYNISTASYRKAVNDMKKTTAQRVLDYMPNAKKKEYKPLLEED